MNQELEHNNNDVAANLEKQGKVAELKHRLAQLTNRLQERKEVKLEHHDHNVDANLEKQKNLLELRQRLSRLTNRTGGTDTAAASAIPVVTPGALATMSITKELMSTAAECLQDTPNSAVPVISSTKQSPKVFALTPLSGHVLAQGELEDTSAASETGKEI